MVSFSGRFRERGSFLIKMKVSVLGSGSKANCSYFESQGVSILVDCGLTAKQTELRMRSLGLDPAELDAIIISHEHGDHIRGASVLSRRYELPIYANEATANFLENVFEIRHFKTGKDFDLCFRDSSIRIKPFSVVHDAADPVGFVIESNNKKFSYLTDTGKITTLIKQKVSYSDILILEANYDKDLLSECQYPWELKQRISSSHGHLSTCESAKFLREVDHSGLSHVILVHLSENSNSEIATLNRMKKIVAIEDFDTFICAKQKEPTPLIQLEVRPKGNLKVA